MSLKIVKDAADEQDAATSEKAVKKRDVAARWGGDPRIISKGFVAVPTLFLQQMSQFKPYSLTPAEALFVICIMAHKWDERDPFPSYKRIASWMGKSESYVRRLAKNLTTKGLLTRQQRIGQTNSFDFKKLFDRIVAAGSPVPAAEPKRKQTKSPSAKGMKRGKKSA